VNRDHAPGGGGLGWLLRQHRLASGLTQEELAARAGLSVRAIANIERGRTLRPYRRSVHLLADALGLAGPQLEELDRASRPVAADGVADGKAVAGARDLVVVPRQPDATGPPCAVATERPAQLPRDVPGFTGRVRQVGRLRDLLAERHSTGQVPIAVITGAGGIGKSALAVHVGHLLRDDFPDGQLFIDLQGSRDQSLASIDALARLVRHLGGADAAMTNDPAELAADYRTRIADRQMLIILDDARDAAQVRPLLPGTATSAVLITSRSWLPGLEVSCLLELDTLNDLESLGLFAGICGEGRVAAEPAATAAVLAACGGLPLAIRIAASRLLSRPGWSVGELATELAGERRRLEELRVGDLAVRATFEVSYTALLRTADQAGADAARAFRLLGLWPGPDISLSAAAALLGRDSRSAGRLLEKLLDIHLLDSPAHRRYRFHDLIRIFAAERAEHDEARESRELAVGRILTWYLHTANAARLKTARGTTEREISLSPAEASAPPLAFADSDAATDWSDKERANMAAGVLLANAWGMDAICAQLAAISWRNFLRRPWHGWIDVLQTGIDSTRRSADAGSRAWLLTYLGAALNIQGANNEAVACLQEALPLSRQAADALCEATATLNLGMARKDQHRYQDAIVHFETTLTLHRALGSRHVGSVLMNLGIVFVQAGRLQEGVTRMEEALAVLIQAGNRTLESLAHSELAGAYRQMGRTDDAVRWARSALDISRKIHDQYQETAAWQALGQALADMGDHDQARASLASAHALATRLGIAEAAAIGELLAALDPAGSAGQRAPGPNATPRGLSSSGGRKAGGFARAGAVHRPAGPAGACLGRHLRRRR
jgi:tetratricopeptide (TPR) repeat protein/transcriptional regulator with XRE-family HTH domain